MITLKELNPKGFQVPEEHQKNLLVLHERMNKVREAWGHPMIVRSGYRTVEDQIRIYKEMGKEPKLGSCHLKGAACDIVAATKDFREWVVKNESLLAEIGLWMEKLEATPNWIHFQIFPPASGDRFFWP